MTRTNTHLQGMSTGE